MAPLPIINMEFAEAKEALWNKIHEPTMQRKLILVIVSIALLLDNMLYMVIVPIIPDYLRYVGAVDAEEEEVVSTKASNTTGQVTPRPHDHHGQDTSTGLLFASKAIVQLMVNPFSGAIIDRIGYDIPMMIGLIVMFLSTSLFACGRSYSGLFFARALQGVGSAFADTAGLAMIADRFTEEAERTKALGIALAFISFGCLVAPPFGGALYQFAGKEFPFLILALISLLDGFMLLLVMKPIKQQIRESQSEMRPESIPIWQLMMDPYIAVCAGALMMSNVALAFLEPTISLWMEDTMTTDNWKIGMIWLPAFFPHVFGVIITVKMARRYPQHQWRMAAIGLALEGISCLFLPFITSYQLLTIPICVICFGIALIDTALLPMLGYLVDTRYVSVYGSIYAIADISYSLAYAVGPIIAGGIVEMIGFVALNFLIAILNLGYVPVLRYLRNVYDFKPFEENEANVLMSDPPPKEYQTYNLQNQQQVGDYKNHLEYGNLQEQGGGGGGAMQETNIDQYDYSQQQQYQQDYNYQQQQYQPGYQEQGGAYNQQQQQQPQQRNVQANPFRQQPEAAPQAAPRPPVANPFR